MSKSYQLTEETLLKIIKTSYEAGCDGYMDLRDNTCFKLLQESLTMCKYINESNNSSFSVQTTYTNSSISASADFFNLNDQFNFYSNV